MYIFRFICIFICAALPLAASAQMKMVSKEKLESVSNPALSEDSAAFSFDARHIKAEPMNEDDTPVVFRYRFRNVSDKTLKIGRIASTCSCASASCPVSAVAPGESSEILVRYDPKGHPGRFERRIFVYTDNDSEPAAVPEQLREAERVGAAAGQGNNLHKRCQGDLESSASRGRRRKDNKGRVLLDR